jgi:Mn2+/Fe2+ NRAMP family transporter
MAAVVEPAHKSILRMRMSRFWQLLGPGLITGASDDDPSGIGTYSQAGAQRGFGIGWTMLLTYPLMVAIQEISARLGRTTGCGIAGNLRRHYPPWLLQIVVALLFIANTFNIGADLGAMGDAARLVLGVPPSSTSPRSELSAHSGCSCDMPVSRAAQMDDTVALCLCPRAVHDHRAME